MKYAMKKKPSATLIEAEFISSRASTRDPDNDNDEVETMKEKKRIILIATIITKRVITIMREIHYEPLGSTDRVRRGAI